MREYHEVWRELEGEEAVAYMGPARTLLGALKNQMQLGGLLQGAHKVDLPDGTTIKVQSIFGQDKITIVAPAPGGVAPTEHAIEVQLPTLQHTTENPPIDFAVVLASIRGCGEYSRHYPAGNSAYPRPYYWSQATGLVDILEGKPGLIDSPGAANDAQGRAYAISGDGSTVVGYYYDGVSNKAFRWKPGPDEFQVLAAGAAAYGVSYDGSEVLISGPGPSSWARWKGGVVTTFATNIDVPFRPRMSQNGQYVCGQAKNGSISGGAKAWDRQGREYTCPRVGTFPAIWYARAVSNDGIVVLDENLRSAFWNVHTNEIVDFTGFLSIWHVSPDGQNVVGQGGAGDAFDEATWRTSDGTLRVLPPGAQPFVSSHAFCCDAARGVVVIGGTAAIEGKTDNHAPTTNDAFWVAQGGTIMLNRIAPHPDAILGDGGLFWDITLGGIKFQSDPADVATEAALKAVLGR